MPKRIVLLTGEVEAPHFSALIERQAPGIEVVWVPDRAALDRATAGSVAGTRVVAALTDVIVPAALLEALDGPAYNFHPGPPEYPGSHASGFAIYEGAARFGVTLHEMAARIDSGPIIEVRRFDVPPDSKFQALEMMAFTALVEMFTDYAPALATDDTPLPHATERWTGRRHTKAEAARLSRIESHLTEEEITRRYRAFG